MVILTLSVWGWREPGWWLTPTGRRTELAGWPGCSLGPTWYHETGGAAGDGSGGGAAAGGDVRDGAEAAIWAGSCRMVRYEKASVGMRVAVSWDHMQGSICFKFTQVMCLGTMSRFLCFVLYFQIDFFCPTVLLLFCSYPFLSSENHLSLKIIILNVKKSVPLWVKNILLLLKINKVFSGKYIITELKIGLLSELMKSWLFWRRMVLTGQQCFKHMRIL